MVAHTVEIAMAQATTVAPAGAGADETPFRTHRYLMGSDEKMERSQLVASACNRSVLRTLRGSLLSVPVRPVADQPPCIKPYQLQR